MKKLAIITLALAAFASRAYALCDEGATGGRCTINGQPGHHECLGGHPRCVPDHAPPPHVGTTPRPAPVHGTIKPKYYVLTVVYAPPGTNGGRSSSSVSYGTSSTTGATVSTTNSYKPQFTAQVSGTFPLITGVSDTIGGSFSFSRSTSNTDSLTIEKTGSTTIQVAGPSADGIDHDHDLIYLWLNPEVDVAVTPTTVAWMLTGTSEAIIQYVYAGHLKHPDQMPHGVMQLLQHYGITNADFPDILKRDPFAAPYRPVRPVRFPRAPISRTSPPLDTKRFQQLLTTFPYEPPFSATDPVPTFNFTVSNADTAVTASSAVDDYKVGITNSVDLTTPDAIKASLKSDASWDWTNTASQSTSARDVESASVTVGGPAFGYTGPTNMEAFYDRIYKTFLFRPLDIQTLAFKGRAIARNGKAAAGREIVLFANGRKYRTFTDAHGEYRFFGSIKGPVKLQAGTVIRSLPQFSRGKLVDLTLH